MQIHAHNENNKMNQVIAASLLLLATSVMAISDPEKTVFIERYIFR